MDEIRTELEQAKRQIAAMEQEKREEKIVSELRGEIQDLRKSLEDSRRPDIADSVLSNFDKIVLGLASFRPQQTPAELMSAMSETIKNLKQTAGPDEMEKLVKLAGLYNQMAESLAQAQPPVVAGGPMGTAQGWKGGAGEFLGGVLASFDAQSGGKLTQAMTSFAGRGMPKLTSPAKPQVGAGLFDQPVGSGQGFSGVATGTPGTQAQQSIDFSKLNLAALGLDPIADIRRRLGAREPVDDVASRIIYVVDFAGTFCDPQSPLMGYLVPFVHYPETMLDQFVPLIPELSDAPEKYVADLKEAIIVGMRNYLKQEMEQQASEAAAQAAGKPEPTDETVEKQGDQEPAEAGADEVKEEG